MTTTTVQKPKSDWFKNFPISNIADTVDPTPPIRLKLLEFIKLLLANFYPDLSQHISTGKTKKTSFNTLLKELAQQWPDFIIDLIQKANPNIPTETTIPFTIIFETFKKLLHSFTTRLFNQTNYKKFFQSQHFSTLPSIKHRSQIAINLARLHLFFLNKYQTIDYLKFINNLKLKLISLILKFSITHDIYYCPPLKINAGSANNIYIQLNLQAEQFKQNFRIPSFTKYKPTLDSWFFNYDKKHRENYPYTDTKKLYKYIKFKIIHQYTEEYKNFYLYTFKYQISILFNNVLLYQPRQHSITFIPVHPKNAIFRVVHNTTSVV